MARRRARGARERRALRYSLLLLPPTPSRSRGRGVEGEAVVTIDPPLYEPAVRGKEGRGDVCARARARAYLGVPRVCGRARCLRYCVILFTAHLREHGRRQTRSLRGRRAPHHLAVGSDPGQVSLKQARDVLDLSQHTSDGGGAREAGARAGRRSHGVLCPGHLHLRNGAPTRVAAQEEVWVLRAAAPLDQSSHSREARGRGAAEAQASQPPQPQVPVDASAGPRGVPARRRRCARAARPRVP